MRASINIGEHDAAQGFSIVSKISLHFKWSSVYPTFNRCESKYTNKLHKDKEYVTSQKLNVRDLSVLTEIIC